MKEQILDSVRETLGDNITSLMLYQRYNQRLLVIVLQRADITALTQIQKTLKKQPFIVFVEHDLDHGEDVFPLEYLHMKTHTTLVEGKDYFKDMKLKKSDVRTQLEYELRNKLIYLRQDFLLAPDQKKFLEKIFPQFVIFLEALFFLKSKKPERDLGPDLERIEELYDLSFTAFKWILNVQEGEAKLHKLEIPDMIQAVHDQLEALLHVINKLKV